MKRMFSTAGPAGSSTSATPPPTVLSVSKLRSRRVYNAERERRPSSLGKAQGKDGGKKGSGAADEKPWPKNMVRAAWAAGAVLVPYTCAWASAVFPQIRDRVYDSHELDGIPDRLRRHFGEEDWRNVAYVDVLVDDDDKESGNSDKMIGTTDPSKIPHSLPGEGTVLDRRVAAEVEGSLLSNKEVKVKLVPVAAAEGSGNSNGGGWAENSSTSYDNDGGNGVVVKTLPASLAVNHVNLIGHLPDDIKNRFGGGGNFVTVAVDFIDDDDLDEDTVGDAQASAGKQTDIASGASFDKDTTSFGREERTAETASNSKKKEPLIGSVHTYSTWYYQAPLQHLQDSSAAAGNRISTAQHVTSSVTDDEIRLRTLEADLARLEDELRDLNSSTRPYDDIQDELNSTRAALRRLKWKKWVPW